MTPQDRERALRLVKKGDEQLAKATYRAARLIYERAADAGLAQGAMALAATFDAAELAPRRARHPARPKQAGAGTSAPGSSVQRDAEQRLRRIGAN